MPSDMDLALNSLNSNMVECNSAAEKLTILNAFDIISLSNGFDLSGIFEHSNKESKFMSTNTAMTIITKLMEVAKSLDLKVITKTGGLLNMEAAKSGIKGVMSINAEIFQITPNYHLVEIKKINGDILEYHNFMNQSMRPALEDIVWAWHGEQPDEK